MVWVKGRRWLLNWALQRVTGGLLVPHLGIVEMTHRWPDGSVKRRAEIENRMFYEGIDLLLEFAYRGADGFAPAWYGRLFAGSPADGAVIGGLTGEPSALIFSVFTTADDAAFNDRTLEARIAKGTPFMLFPTPATGDRVYVGHTATFTRLDFDLETLGVGGAYVWEYWNGTAWTALTVTDGTSGFTADGVVTWTAPGDWAQTTVNGQSRYWVRVRPTGVPSTNPTVNSITVAGYAVLQWTRNTTDWGAISLVGSEKQTRGLKKTFGPASQDWTAVTTFTLTTAVDATAKLWARYMLPEPVTVLAIEDLDFRPIGVVRAAGA